MSGNRDLVTTSVSIPSELLERAKVRASASYRTLSQYVCYLIDQELVRSEAEEARRGESDHLGKTGQSNWALNKNNTEKNG